MLIVGAGALVDTLGLEAVVSLIENKFLGFSPKSNFLISGLEGLVIGDDGLSSNNLSISTTDVSVLVLIFTEGTLTCVGLDKLGGSPILLLLTNKSIPTVSAEELNGFWDGVFNPTLTLLRDVSRSRFTSSISFLFIGISFILYIYATEKLKLFKMFLL